MSKQKQNGIDNIQAGRDVTQNIKSYNAIVSIVAIIAVVVIFAVSTIFKQEEPDIEQSVVHISPTMETEGIILPAETLALPTETQGKYLQISLIPWQKNMSEDEFKSAYTMIKERLNLLSADCSMDYSNYKIHASIPRESLIYGDYTEKDIINLLGFIANASSGKMFLHEDNDHFLQIFNENIISCEINEHWPEGKALVIYFTKEQYQSIVDFLSYERQESSKPTLQFKYSNYFISPSEYSREIEFNDVRIFNDKEYAIAVVNDNLYNNRMHEILGIAMTQGELPSAFQYQIDYQSITNWEKIDNISNIGQNQVDDVGGITVDIILKVQTDIHYSEEIWLAINEKMKKRLNSMGVPYQYGYRDLIDRGIVIRLPIKYVGEDIIGLLILEHIPKYVKIGNRGETITIEKVDFLKEDNGNYFIVTTLMDFKNELVGLDHVLFLNIGNVKISSNSIENVNDNRIIFDDLYFCGEDNISKEYEFLIMLLNYLCNEENDAIKYQSPNLTLEATQINKPENDKYKYTYGVTNETKWDTYIQNNCDRYPEITKIKHIKDGIDLIIFSIQVPEDNQGMEFIEIVERIYTELDLDKSYYSRISFDQVTSNINKQCTIQFDSNSLSTGYYIYLAILHSENHGIDKIKTYLSENEFWESKLIEESGLYLK